MASPGGARARRQIAAPVAWTIIIALAVALRIWMWSYQAQSGAVQPGDPEEYYRSAVHLLGGGYYDTGKWLRPPLYPLFLALCFGLLGPSVSSALLAQAVLTGLAVPVFGWMAWQLFRRRDAALLAGLIAALLVPLAHFGSVLFAEALFVLLAVGGLAALDRALARGTSGAAMGAGALLGLAALTRAVGLNFIPIAAAMLLILAHRGSAAGWRGLPWRPALALLLGAALVIGPWAARNYAAHGRLILSDTNGGISMWYGTIRGEQEQLAGEAQLWAVPNPADRQSLALRWAAENIARDPLWFVGRMRFKVASLYLLQLRSYAVGDIITISPRDEQVALGAGESPLRVTLAADAQYVALMLLGIAGLCRAPQPRRALPTLAWVLFITLMSAVTIGHPRLRLPILAALVPWAAYALALLGSRVRSTKKHESHEGLAAGLSRSESPMGSASKQEGHRHSRAGPSLRVLRALRGKAALRAGLMLAGWLVFLALIFSTRYLAWQRTWRDLELAGHALQSDGPNAARIYIERARAADPANALRVIDLADLAFREGDYAEAIRLYGESFRLEDRNLYAHAMRARAAALFGRPDTARHEQLALAGYGRDNNDIYAWAWEAWDDPPRTSVVPGDAAALGQYAGFAPATPDLAGGRWTLGDARLRLADSCGDAVLRVRGPAGRAVTVEAEGRGPPQVFTLSGAEQELRVALECPAGAPSAPQATPRPALEASPLFRRPATTIRVRSAVALLEIERAPWYTGVAVLEARVEGGK